MLTSNLPLRLNICFEIRFDVCKPLLDTAFDISATLLDISEDLSGISSWIRRDVEFSLLRDKQVSASASQKIYE